MLGKNIIELQEELSYMPMDRLVGLVDDPNSVYGSLPLIEIQNRKQLQESSKPSEQITTVADDIISSVATPTSMDSSSPTSLDPASGGIAQLPMRQMSGGGTVRYNEGGGITIQDVREMLGMPREGFDQRENYPPYYDDDGNIIGYDTRTELGKKLGPKFNYEPPIQNKSEGESVYSNPYFGDADPEEVRKLQEIMPGLSTEDAVAMVLGIDTADITTGYDDGGLATLRGEAVPKPLSELELLRKTYGYKSDEEFDKQKRMLMLMQLGANIAKAEDFSDVIEGNQDIFTTRMALEEQRREDDLGLAALRLKGLSDPSDVKSLTGALAEAESLGYDQESNPNHQIYLNILRELQDELAISQSQGIDSLNTVKADLSPLVASSGSVE